MLYFYKKVIIHIHEPNIYSDASWFHMRLMQKPKSCYSWYSKKAKPNITEGAFTVFFILPKALEVTSLNSLADVVATFDLPCVYISFP